MTSESLVAAGEIAYTRVVLEPVRYADQAADLVRRARAAADPEALVVALRAHAWALHTALNNAAAVRLLDEAVRVAESHGLDRRLGDVLMSRAMTELELGRGRRAYRDLERAERFVSNAHRPELLLQRAMLDHNAGHADRAAQMYRRVLTESGCPPIIWVKAANNLSVAQTQLGRPRVALRYLERAAALAEELGPMAVAVIANSQAWSSYHDGQVTRSLRLFEEAGRLYRAAGAPLGEHYLDYADVLVDLRLLDEARRAAGAAAREFTRHGARLMAAEARLRSASLALALGDDATALAEGMTAERDLRRQRRPPWLARAVVIVIEAQVFAGGHSATGLRRLRRAAATLERYGLDSSAVAAHLAAGRSAVSLGDRGAARLHFGRATELSRRRAVVVRLRGRLAAALLADADGDADAVLRHCRAGLADLARYRAALPSMELRMLASGHGTELGELGLKALLPTAHPPRILAWLERTRAASLMVAEPSAPEANQDVVALRSAEHELRAARREHGIEPAELMRRHAALEARLRRRSWQQRGAVTGSGEVVSAAEIRMLLDGGWLVEYAAIDGYLHCVVVGPRRTYLIALGPVRTIQDDASALLFALRRMLGGRFAREARSAADAAVEALTARLVAPLGIPNDAPLVVVPSRSLLHVPWSPLHDAPTTVAPSATFWARSRQRTPTSGRVVVIAGPGLPGASAEATEVGSIHHGSTVLLPPDSSVEATIGALAGADLGHVGCHGHLRWDNPLFSSLQLADGPLTIFELFERGVAPRRVVLAACESAVQRSYDGGEVLGFVSALMARGTAGVVASLLDLPDGMAVPVLTAMHRHLARGCSLAAALRRARSEAADDVAGFVTKCALTAYGAA